MTKGLFRSNYDCLGKKNTGLFWYEMIAKTKLMQLSEHPIQRLLKTFQRMGFGPKFSSFHWRAFEIFVKFYQSLTVIWAKRLRRDETKW